MSTLPIVVAPAGPAALAWSPLERAILAAVLYTDLFDYPLSAAEIQRFLPDHAATLDEVVACLRESPRLRAILASTAGYWHRRGRVGSLHRRRQREAVATSKWRRLRRALPWLSALPFVRMVAVTGSLAVGSAVPDADFDLMLVVAPGTVYFTLALLRLLRRLRLFGPICPNVIYDEQHLAIEERDLFTARELLQAVPVYGLAMHARLLAANRWAGLRLPNHPRARDCAPPAADVALPAPLAAFKRAAERGLPRPLVRGIETWRRQRCLVQAARRGRLAEVRLEPGRFQEHLGGHRGRVLAELGMRLDTLGLALPPVDAAVASAPLLRVDSGSGAVAQRNGRVNADTPPRVGAMLPALDPLAPPRFPIANGTLHPLGWQRGDAPAPSQQGNGRADLPLRAPGLPTSGSGGAWADRVKRALDVVLAGVGLLLTAPLVAAAAVAVRLDSPGPAFFRQQRVGKDGRLFTLLKLRTMRVDTDPYDPAPRSRDDRRVTRVGRLLRRFSLDELPQLWNVLRGEMSLVGPRPELPPIVGRYQPWERERLTVRPGLTGWWQVHARSHLPLALASHHDIYYVRHRSLWLDLAILARTVRAILSGDGAY